jgi:uncharacterized protein YkwD
MSSGRLLRKILTAVLAVPVIAGIYASVALQRSIVARLGVALGLGAFIAFGVMSLARPATTTASRPTEIVPLTQAAFTSVISTDVGIDAPMTITFTTAMAPDSVASSISIEPPTPVRLSWDATGTILTVAPQGHWQAGTYHTITVQPGALALTGRPLTKPARAVFLTRAPAAAVLAATAPIGKRVAPDTGFTVTFDRPVDTASLAGSIHLEPAIAGEISTGPSGDGATVVDFQPEKPLKADTRYRLVVDGVRDADGLPIGSSALEVRTIVAPTVVRFRPRDETDAVDRGAAISVRFTTRMDRAAAKAAFKVVADGKAVDGKVSFAESDTVLVFVPASALPYGAKVVASVGTSATSRDGVSLVKAASATFQTVEKPKPKPKPKPAPKPVPKSSGSSGGSVGAGSWAAVERYYLKLMNCTRTGGWVTSSGSCSSPGGRDAAPLKLSAGISSKVSRPYAKLLARRGLCSHFIGGNPGDRLRRAGYTSYRWAENIGCRSGNPYGAVLGSHRFFQSEKPYSGGHYVNLMNRKYDRVGIGVWVSSGRVRLVVDFYHP